MSNKQTITVDAKEWKLLQEDATYASKMLHQYQSPNILVRLWRALMG